MATYMTEWRIRPGHYKEAAKQFLATGAPRPEGLTSLGRWHAPGSSSGWDIVEGTPEAMAELAAEWGHLLSFKFTPVINDEAAGASIAKVHG